MFYTGNPKLLQKAHVILTFPRYSTIVFLLYRYYDISRPFLSLSFVYCLVKHYHCDDLSFFGQKIVNARSGSGI